MITFVASILIWLMFFGLLILWVIDGKHKKEIVIHVLFSCFAAWLLSESIKYFFPTLRPYATNGLDPLTLTVPVDGAFPSTHTAIGFALAITIFKHHKKMGLLYLVLAFFVGLARILAHVHYPLDVMGGALLGTIVSLLTSSRHFVRLLR